MSTISGGHGGFDMHVEQQELVEIEGARRELVGETYFIYINIHYKVILLVVYIYTLVSENNIPLPNFRKLKSAKLPELKARIGLWSDRAVRTKVEKRLWGERQEEI
jgi:hypothetical protein